MYHLHYEDDQGSSGEFKKKNKSINFIVIN